MVNPESPETRGDQPGRILPVAYGHRHNMLTMLLGAVILLSGIGIGVGGVMFWLGRTAGPEGWPGRDGQTAESITNRIARVCQLDDRQRDEVRRIVARQLEALKGIRQEMAEKVLAEHKALREEIKQVLTPEQFKRWTQHMDRVRARSPYRRRRPGRRGPRGRRSDGRQRPSDGRSRSAPRLRSAARLLRQFDANHDNRLTVEEVPPRLWPRLLQADRNGDGAVSRQELDQAAGRSDLP